jgi:hypothetical protein
LDLIKFGQLLSQLLPKIKTKIQLSGLAIGLAFALFVHFAKPGDGVALRNGMLNNCVFGTYRAPATMNATAKGQWRSPG